MNDSMQQQRTEAALPTSSLATVSLAAGIAGFVMLPVLASIVALWAGYQARKETRAQPPLASGDSMATAGIVMGYIQLVLACVGALCLLVYAVWFVFVIAQQG